MGRVAYACRCGYLISEEVPRGQAPGPILLALEAEGKENHSCTFTNGGGGKA